MLLILSGLLAPEGRSADVYTGIQAIGFSKWSLVSVTNLARDFRAIGGNLELASLPVEFRPDAPYANLNSFLSLLHGTELSASGLFTGRLRLTVHLWFHRDEIYQKQKQSALVYRPFTDVLGKKFSRFDPFYWDTFAQPLSFSDHQVDWEATFNSWSSALRTHHNGATTVFLKEYGRRVVEFASWARQVAATYQGKIGNGTLSIVLCPYLEDSCTGQADFTNAVHWIQSVMTGTVGDVPGITFRRSAGDNNFRVDDLPLEVHGYLRPGDTDYQWKAGDIFSNDGTRVPYSPHDETLSFLVGPDGSSQERLCTLSKGQFSSSAEFNQLTMQLTGAAKGSTGPGVSVLLWRSRYNLSQNDVKSKRAPGKQTRKPVTIRNCDEWLSAIRAPRDRTPMNPFRGAHVLSHGKLVPASREEQYLVQFLQQRPSVLTNAGTSQ